MKWILILILHSPNSQFMMKFPDPFPAKHECVEAGEIWAQNARSFSNHRFVCLPSYVRPD